MPTIAQLPPASTISSTDELPISQGGVSRSVAVGTLLENLQPSITLATNALLGRTSPGPGGPESIALGPGLEIQNDVLTVNNSGFPQTGSLDLSSQMLTNSNSTGPQLMPVSLLRGLYTPGNNISIDNNGTISSSPSVATGSSIGAVAVGEALVINASGQLSVNIGTVTGTVAAGNDGRIVGAEQSSNKNEPNGYCGLDNTGVVPYSLLPPFASSPVESVNGQVGAVVLTASNIQGLGSIASQEANDVSLTGGIISGIDASQMPVTPGISGAQSRVLAEHLADFVNIDDFGLARNGISDDSALFITACQAAIAANKALKIPAGGPILLTDAAQQSLSNIKILGAGIRDYDGPNGYGYVGSSLWMTGVNNSPFLIGPNVHIEGINFFWPNQTEVATVNNGGKPISYPPLFTTQNPAQNITYFNFIDCQVTNCYDFFTSSSKTAAVGACTIERCLIYAINNCFTFTNNPEVFFISNCLFSWGAYGSVVSVGPTYNLRTFTNTQGTWMKVLGDGTVGQLSSTTVGGILSSNNYVYGSSRGLWLAAGTLDISCFVDTSFDTVPTVIQGDPGCAIFSTRITGGAWYPIYYTQTAPDTTAVIINNPAPGGIGTNVSFSGITIPFINGSFVNIEGSNVSNLSFLDIRCNAFGHTTGGVGPYFGFQLSVPNANVRIVDCDFQPASWGLSNTGIQILACAQATISGCVFRGLSAPIDIETLSGVISIFGNTTLSTQGSSVIVGIGQANVRDLGNSWDISNFAYNGFAPSNFRPGATIGITPVASTSSSSYVGLQPSSSGTAGGTRFGVTALGSSPVSILTNSFTEEQVRVSRVPSAVNYLSLKGSASGGVAQVTTGGGDANSALQVTGLASGVTYLGSSGPSGSPVIRLGGIADQSYVTSVPSNGFTLTIPQNCSTFFLRPSVNINNGTVVLPTAGLDGQIVNILTSKTVVALTVNAQSGQYISGTSPFQLNSNSSVGYFWNSGSATWYQVLGSGSIAAGSLGNQNSNAVDITGGTISGISLFQLGGTAGQGTSLGIDSVPGSAKEVLFTSSGSARWVVGAEGNPENHFLVPTTTIASNATSQLDFISTANIASGMMVDGPGVAPGTVVAAISSLTSLTISLPLTATVPSGTNITFYTNQGSDFAILPYDDLGNPLAPTLGEPLTISRATGTTNVKTLQVLGSISVPTPALTDSSTAAANTAFVAATIAAKAVLQSSVGTANGVATLDGTGRVPTAQMPGSVLGALSYQGGWNASTNSPSLMSSSGTKGYFYTVSTAGLTSLDGLSQWNVGDNAVFNGTIWEKIDGVSNEVTSVAGRTGAVVLTTTDISGLGSLATQNAVAVAITGGTMDGVAIGTNTQSSANVSDLMVAGTLHLQQASLSVPAYSGIQIYGGGLLGNARGLGAFDGQQYRTAVSQVASGQYSVQFGINNTSSSPGSITTGSSNTLTGQTGYNAAFGIGHSISGGFSLAAGSGHVLSGTYTSAHGYKCQDFGRFGIRVFSNGSNTATGDAQISETVLRGISPANGALRLTSDGNAASLINTVNVQGGQLLKLNIEILGYNASGNSASCWYARDLLLGRAASMLTTTLSSTTLSAGGSIGTISTWTPPVISADIVNGGLSISSGFHPTAVIKWVARVTCIEAM